MNKDDQTEENHKSRSRFIRKLIQNPANSNTALSGYTKKPKKTIFQFWDRLDRLPHDVQECLETWTVIENQGIERLLFDKHQARDFILKNMELGHLRAFDKCYHPAMQSDYFRLCYIFMEGGCYIDADDVYNGAEIQHLFDDGRLKIQPLCYDTATSMMVPTQAFTKMEADDENWIFYVNNNPLIACSHHPIIARALYQATLMLEKKLPNCLPEIQSTTGPGNLSKTIFDAITENTELEHTLLILNNWENIAKSKWELSYRNDTRNWRHSNGHSYQDQ